MVRPASPCRIVLAEDNPADVRLVKEALRQHEVRCELSVISDGEELVSFIRELDRNSETHCPDLLLLDLHLPKRNGNEVLQHLRASSRCGQVQVVVLTSSDAPSDLQCAEQNAAVHYFRKPMSLDQFMHLGRIIKDVLSQGNGESRSQGNDSTSNC
jgi:chemotaxis family two-component system response regulator Rcp1